MTSLLEKINKNKYYIFFWHFNLHRTPRWWRSLSETPAIVTSQRHRVPAGTPPPPSPPRPATCWSFLPTSCPPPPRSPPSKAVSPSSAPPSSTFGRGESRWEKLQRLFLIFPRCLLSCEGCWVESGGSFSRDLLLMLRMLCWKKLYLKLKTF